MNVRQFTFIWHENTFLTHSAGHSVLEQPLITFGLPYFQTEGQKSVEIITVALFHLASHDVFAAAVSVRNDQAGGVFEDAEVETALLGVVWLSRGPAEALDEWVRALGRAPRPLSPATLLRAARPVVPVERPVGHLLGQAVHLERVLKPHRTHPQTAAPRPVFLPSSLY